ncbi:MAG: phosphatase PAP2 family protein [Nocardioidaceae bacterium]|nr:phosphatase PAP2 family protein [Nocardioidaceae bacterium]MCL2612039.1 phosphatase PAP2 family protein [Nocardioidaceae bacterium]
MSDTEQVSTTADTTPVARGLKRQVIGLWVVVLCFIAVGIARSIQVGIPFRDPGGDYLRGRIAETVGFFIALVLVDGLLRTRGRRAPRAVLTTIRQRWTPKRIGLAWVALIAYHLTYFTYHNLKSWDVFLTNRDKMLLSWDKALFFGHSPAVLLHDLFGEHLAAHVFMVWYETFPVIVLVAFPAAIVLPRRLRDGYADIASFAWIWILGTITYYAIPSLGPFEVAPKEFAGLPHSMIQTTQAAYLAQRNFLLAHPHSPHGWAQISAFASLHVGVTTVIFGLAVRHRLRIPSILLGVFLVGTMLATVYLGWHFAVDIPAGLVIGALSLWLGPRTVGVRRRITGERATDRRGRLESPPAST